MENRIFNAQDFSGGVVLPQISYPENFGPVDCSPVRKLSVRPVTQDELAYFETLHRHKLGELDIAMQNTHATRIALEGGHVYTDENIDDQHRNELRLTALLKAHLSQLGFTVINVLFVDNFHPVSNGFNVDDYVAEAAAQGWLIDHVVYEQDMIPLARVMVETLEQMGKVISKDGGLLLKRGAKKVELVTRKEGHHSCAVLDAALSLLKYKELRAHAIVNVLRREYRQQQANTRTILKGLLEQDRLPFFDFFIDSKHENEVTAGRPHWLT